MNRLAFFVLLSLASCKSFFKVNVLIDNPANKEFTVYVDGNKNVIEKLGSIEVKLAKGEHQFVAAFGNDTVFNSLVSTTTTGLLNLQKELYVLNKELYLADETAFDMLTPDLLKLQEYEINGMTYQDADFEIFEGDTFIMKHWDFGVNEEYPDEFNSENDSYAIVTKLFRIDDLEKFWGFYGNFDFTNPETPPINNLVDSIEKNVLKADSAQ